MIFIFRHDSFAYVNQNNIFYFFISNFIEIIAIIKLFPLSLNVLFDNVLYKDMLFE